MIKAKRYLDGLIEPKILHKHLKANYWELNVKLKFSIGEGIIWELFWAEWESNLIDFCFELLVCTFFFFFFWFSRERSLEFLFLSFWIFDFFCVLFFLFYLCLFFLTKYTNSTKINNNIKSFPPLILPFSFVSFTFYLYIYLFILEELRMQKDIEGTK